MGVFVFEDGFERD